MSKPYIHIKTGAKVDVSDHPQGEWTDTEMRARGYLPADDPAAKAALEKAKKDAAAAKAKAEKEAAEKEAAAKAAADGKGGK